MKGAVIMTEDRDNWRRFMTSPTVFVDHGNKEDEEEEEGGEGGREEGGGEGE